MALTEIHTLNRSAKDRLEPISFHVEQVVDGLVNVELNTAYSYDVINVTTKLEAGTCTAEFRISGVAIQGIDAISVTTTRTTTSATDAYAMPVGGRLTLHITSATDAAKLGVTIMTRRTGLEGQ